MMYCCKSPQIVIKKTFTFTEFTFLFGADPSIITGSNNLMIHYGLQNSFSKFCKKEGKEELSAFLPNLPGYIDTPGMQDNR